MRRRLRPWPKPQQLPELAFVFIHGFEASPAWVHENARDIMDGFDELPKKLRDLINYAPTPEGGARATFQIVDDLLERHRRPRRRAG